jgi:hypothetical protein
MIVAEAGESVQGGPLLMGQEGLFSGPLNSDTAKEAISEKVASILDSDMTPETQWEQLVRVVSYDSEPQEHAQYCAELLSYARNGNSGHSVLLRAKALDSVMSKINFAVNYEPEVASHLDSATLREYEDMKQAVPEFFEHAPWQLGYAEPIQNQEDGVDTSYNERSLYFDAIRRLSGDENISADRLFSEYFSFDFECTYFSAPRLPFYLMERLGGTVPGTDLEDGPFIRMMAPATLRDIMDVAITHPDTPGYAEKADTIREFARLAHLVKQGGIEHHEPIEALYGLPEPERVEYARLFNRVYDSAELLRDFFPAELADGVIAGQRTLFANALFAVVDHVQNGMITDASIELIKRDAVPVQFTGNRPFKLLEKWVNKIERAHKRVTSPTTQRHEVVKGDGFTIIDFVNPEDSDSLMVMLNIRPEFGKKCNFRYEYGSNKYGVDATIDWRIDEGTLDLQRPYHKTSRTPESVSWRTDREGRPPENMLNVPDLPDEVGSVSFDSGSILATGFNGDLARLLARGNYLRGHRHGNHMPDYIDQKLGIQSRFAQVARTMLHAVLNGAKGA